MRHRAEQGRSPRPVLAVYTSESARGGRASDSARTLGIYEVLRSETKQNLGEGRAEPRTVYPLLYEGERLKGAKAQRPLAFGFGRQGF